MCGRVLCFLVTHLEPPKRTDWCSPHCPPAQALAARRESCLLFADEPLNLLRLVDMNSMALHGYLSSPLKFTKSGIHALPRRADALRHLLLV